MHPREQDTNRPDQRERDVDPDLQSDEDLAQAEQKSFVQESERREGETAQPRHTKQDADKELDHGLKETFPASDPVSINPGAD